MFIGFSAARDHRCSNEHNWNCEITITSILTHRLTTAFLPTNQHFQKQTSYSEKNVNSSLVHNKNYRTSS